MSDRAVLIGGPSDGLELDLPHPTREIKIPSPSSLTVWQRNDGSIPSPTSSLEVLTYRLVYLEHRPSRGDDGRLRYKISNA